MTRAILVKTCQRFRSRREACEATWVQALRAADVPVFFVEGGHPQDGWGMLDLPDDGSGWRRRRCNVLQLTTGDDYADNSIKVREAVRHLLGMVPFDSLFICDDNTFVHPVRWLAHEPGGEFEGLMSERIPWVHGGAGFYMSRRCCELYVAGVTKRCSWDDTLATNILTGQHKIEMVNRPDLYAQWDERVSAENDLITCHNVEPAAQFQLFEATRDLSSVHDLLQRT